MKYAWIIGLCAAFISFLLMRGRKGVDSEGRRLRYPLKARTRRLRKIGMATTALLLVGTLLVPTVLANGGFDNFLSMFAKVAEDGSDGDDLDAADGDTVMQANAGANQGQDNEVKLAIDDVVHPGLDLSQEELDVLTAGLDFYVGRQSMTSWLPIRNELCGFQNAVSIPLNLMFLDYDYVEELHGRSKTNPDLKALPTADVLKAISEKIEEWQKAYADLPDDEKAQALKTAIKQEIASNVIFADMVLQFFCTQKYYTENNQWLLEGKDMIDQAYAEPNGLWSLCEYEEGFDEKTPCASAHIVYRNDIMVRTVNSVKEAEEKAAEEQAKADGKTNDGDGAVNGKTTDEEEEEYYSFGYVTLTQMLIALIDDTTPVGICKGMTTVENYYLVETANPAFTRTTLSPEKEESRDVFLLQVIDKSGRIILSYGFNMFDRRIGLYSRTAKPNVVHDPNLEVHYLEEGTNNKVAEPKTEYRVPGTKLDDVKPVSVTNYTCINPDEAKGKIMPDGNLVITFYYRKDQSKPQSYLLTVVCRNEADGKEFTRFSLGKHQKGAVITIPHNNYDGWEFVSGPSTHTMPAKDDTVVLIYRQKSGGGDPDPTPTPKPDGEGGKTPTAGTAQNGEANKGGGDSAAGNGGSDDGSFQDYDAAKAEADRLAAEAAAAEQRRLEEEAERRRQEELRKQQEAEAAKREQENADNQGQGSDLTTEGGEDPELPDKEVPAPSTDWTETTENPDGSSTSTTTNASTGTQTVETTTQDGNGNSTTSSSTSQTDPNKDTEGDIGEPPVD